MTDLSLEEQVAAVMRDASVSVADDVMSLANNYYGALSPEIRARLLAVITDPNPETWDNAYSLMVAGGEGSRVYTLWQAVLKIDPGCPRSCGSIDVTPAERWPYVPDSVTIVTAISNAVAESRS